MKQKQLAVFLLFYAAPRIPFTLRFQTTTYMYSIRSTTNLCLICFSE